MEVTSETQFDEGNPRYYPCCHVRTAVIVISIIKITFEALGIIIAVYFNIPNVKWTVAVRAFIVVVCGVLAIGGMRGIRPAFLIPQIIMQVIIMVGGILGLIFLAIAIHPYIDTYIIIIIIMVVVLLGFEVWFLVVFVRGYKYLKDKKEFLIIGHNSFVAESVPMTSYNPTVHAGGQQVPGHPSYVQLVYTKAPQLNA